MFIKNLDNLGLFIQCPKCGTVYNKANNRDKIKKHIANCEGDLKKRLKTAISIPVCPVLYKNKLY